MDQLGSLTVHTVRQLVQLLGVMLVVTHHIGQQCHGLLRGVFMVMVMAMFVHGKALRFIWFSCRYCIMRQGISQFDRHDIPNDLTITDTFRKNVQKLYKTNNYIDRKVNIMYNFTGKLSHCVLHDFV